MNMNNCIYIRNMAMVSVYRYEGEKVRGQFEGEGTSYFRGGHVYKVTLNIVITFCTFFEY